MTTVTIEAPDELASGYPNMVALQRTLLEDLVIEQRQREVTGLDRAAEILSLGYAKLCVPLSEKERSFVNASMAVREASYSAFRERME